MHVFRHGKLTDTVSLQQRNQKKETNFKTKETKQAKQINTKQGKQNKWKQNKQNN